MARKTLLVLTVALAVMAAAGSQAAQSPQTPLAGSAIPQFVNQLPLLSAAGGPIQTVAGNQPVTIRMCEFKARVLPSTFVPPAGSTYAGYTWVWGYLPEAGGQTTCAGLVDLYDDGTINASSGALETYTGPVILNERDTNAFPRNPTSLTWVNDLPNTAATNVLAWKYSTDQTLHWADPLNNEVNMCNHMAMYPAFGSDCAQNYAGPVPAVIHLHGGEVPPELDGGPDAWVTSDGLKTGHSYYTFPGAPANGATYTYANTQEASPIWFHDHALGITRLNVYAGLAGGYLISDPNLSLASGLANYGLSRATDGKTLTDPSVPLVIQDRMFDTNGQLFFPSDSAANILWTTNPEHPYWVPEFVGDTIVVNGKAWPNFNVEPKRYRFLFLNGSNARTYEMFLTDPVSKNFGPPIWVIGTDGGYLDAAVKIDPAAAKPALNVLRMMPGERYEAIIDFSAYGAGKVGPNGVAYSGRWLLKNNGKTPYPAGAAPGGSTVGRIMQFTVGTCAGGTCPADTSFNPAVDANIRIDNGQKIVRLPGAPGGPAVSSTNVQKTRALTLNEVMGMPRFATDPVTGALNTAYPGGPLEILVNNTKWSGERVKGVTSGHYDFEARGDFSGITVGGITTYYSELPQEGDTEIWEIVNLTADAHPIHLHLVQFQLMNRQAFDTAKYGAAYALAFPGGGYDPMTGLPYPAGVFIPGFGPPLNYNPSVASGNKYGGNPDVATVGKTGKTLYLQGMAMPPNANEAGWKDTIMALPGQVTRLAVRWAPTDLAVQTTGNLGSLYYPFDPSDGLQHGYVWHCHIIDHEDNEMMRPDVVKLNPDLAVPLPAARPLVKGTNY